MLSERYNSASFMHPMANAKIGLQLSLFSTLDNVNFTIENMLHESLTAHQQTQQWLHVVLTRISVHFMRHVSKTTVTTAQSLYFIV